MFNAIFINVTIISWGQYYYWEKTEYTEKPTDQLDHKRLYWVHPNSTDAARLLRQCWYAPISEEDVNLTTTRLRLWRLPLLSPKFTWKYLCMREIILLRHKDKGHFLTSAVYPWKIGAVCDDKNTNCNNNVLQQNYLSYAQSVPLETVVSTSSPISQWYCVDTRMGITFNLYLGA